MYVGRFVVVGPGIAAYRVSSRSFPDREIAAHDDVLTVGPTADAPETDNPYVSYNCVRAADHPAGPMAVVGNGSHVDPIAEKIDLGYPARDAMALSLLALDFEKDDYDTPRVAGVASPTSAYVGTVRRDAVHVEAAGEPTLVATYERDRPEPFDLAAETADATARELYDHAFEHPVCAAAATVDGDGVTTAFVNG